MTPMTPPEILDTPDVAALLRCAVTTVEERARAGDLPGVKYGDGWVFPTRALFERLNELAREQAAIRRKPRPPSAILHAVPKRGRVSRPPVPLPALAQRGATGVDDDHN